MIQRVQWVRQSLEELISQHRPGDRLPSEESLAKTLDVSRATVRSALIALEQEGRIVRRHGLGTFVAQERPLVRASLHHLSSVADIVRDNGYRAEVKGIDILPVTLHHPVASSLGCEDGDPGYRVTRTVYADGTPAVYLVDYLPEKFGDQIIDLRGYSDRMLSYLRSFGIVVDYAITQLSLGRAFEESAQALNISVGDPVLLLTQVAYTALQVPVVYSLGIHREGYVTYSILRHTDARKD